MQGVQEPVVDGAMGRYNGLRRDQSPEETALAAAGVAEKEVAVEAIEVELPQKARQVWPRVLAH
jgi:hypothetical protein